MNRPLFIKTIKQRKALEELLKQAAIPVKDLGPLIGALNVRQVIRDLRLQGFQDIILTRRFLHIDQYGKRSWPGEYFLPAECSSLVEEILKKHTATASENSMAAEQLVVTTQESNRWKR